MYAIRSYYAAGGRRGAQMGTFDIAHPDVASFIRAKREDRRLRRITSYNVCYTKLLRDGMSGYLAWQAIVASRYIRSGIVNLVRV